jgi:hypothetical protein
MTFGQPKTRREIADQLQTTLGAFGVFIIAWGLLYLIADVFDPFGLLSLLAGASLLAAIVALLALLVVASSLLRR